MVRPAAGVLTDRLYGGLPEVYRSADEPLDFPLLRYLRLLGDQASEAEVILDRIDYVPVGDGGEPGDTSELVDPQRADAGWLAWLGQKVGIDVDELPAVGDRRQAIADPQSGWQRGSTRSVIAAVQSVLGGDRKVVIQRHYLNDQWKVAVRTRASETTVLTWSGLETTYANWAEIEAAGSWGALNPRSVTEAIRARRVKPAGVELTHLLGTGDWAAVEAQGSWAGVEALGSWAGIENL